MLFVSVLVPSKGWYAPNEPIEIAVKPRSAGEISLVLTDFTNRAIESKTTITAGEEKIVRHPPAAARGSDRRDVHPLRRPERRRRARISSARRW